MNMYEELLQFQDKTYRDFQVKLIPGYSAEKMIGVRTPVLRDYAKRLYKTNDASISRFLKKLPHRYFDENQLHAFIISEIKDFDECLFQVEAFLPYVDNWATCDQLSPKVFKKNHQKLLPCIKKWLKSEHVFTLRFAVGMLMQHFLNDDFNVDFLKLAASALKKSDDYYVRMMVAWYFATALAKQWDAAIVYIREQKLEAWTHNKTIQKAVESYRITSEQKEYLKTLKVRE
ncbi:MAG TPA: DNA alkylation repair protein [Treponema sp.]|nr:DNA alkylation repair protein [Treponema sp.]